MAHRSFLAVAFAGFGLLACGSGDSASAGGPVLDQSPSNNPNQPVSDTQRPVTNPDQPAPNPNGPAGSGSSGGTTGGICDGLCNEVVDCLGLRGQPGVDEALVECSRDCGVDLEIPPACATVFDSYIGCILDSGLICQIIQEDGNIEPDLTQSCQSEILAVQACAGNQPDPPNNDCTPGGTCACGGDTCDQCVCSLGDETLCADLCAAAN